MNAEANNRRGPVDYKISKGNTDKTLVEFKLASNSKLKHNIANQVKVYHKIAPSLWPKNKNVNQYAIVNGVDDKKFWMVTRLVRCQT